MPLNLFYTDKFAAFLLVDLIGEICNTVIIIKDPAATYNFLLYFLT